MKRFSWGQLILAVVSAMVAASVVTVSVVWRFGLLRPKGNEMYADKVKEIMSLVDEYYIGEMDETTISDYIAAGCIGGLGDRYGSYYSAEEAEVRFDSLYGYFTGMGVRVSAHPDNGTMYVYLVHENSPAEDAGILPGDEILLVDDVDVVKDSYEAALEYIKTQPIGDTLDVTVLRNGVKKLLGVTLRQFDSQSVFYQKIGDYGYIYITSFNDIGVNQFKTAVDKLTKAGAKGLIFDLRNNGGGTITSVTGMLDYLLPKGLIVETRYKDSQYNEQYMSDANEVDLPMVVLTNVGSASASEIFAQSLKDYGKAVTVGSTTYGKGVVQRTFTLSDGSLVVFTIAKYYSKSGYCPDGVGVLPDIETTWTDDELSHRFVNDIEADKDVKAALSHLKGQLS